LLEEKVGLPSDMFGIDRGEFQGLRRRTGWKTRIDSYINVGNSQTIGMILDSCFSLKRKC